MHHHSLFASEDWLRASCNLGALTPPRNVFKETKASAHLVFTPRGSVCCLFLDAVFLTPHNSLDFVDEETKAGKLITCSELHNSGGTWNKLSMRQVSCPSPSDPGSP